MRPAAPNKGEKPGSGVEKCRSCGRSIPRRAAGPPRPPGAKGFHPFCSERCRLVDLSKWLNGEYRIPGEPVITESAEDTDA